MLVRRIVVGVLAAGLSVGPVLDAHAQSQGAAAPNATRGRPSQPPATTPEPRVDVDELPISVDRIGERLSRPAPITLELAQPMFRVEVIETRPEWLGDIEWLPEEERGLPAPSGPAWHREFLSMVTPQQARPFGQVQGWDLLQLVASSFAQGVAANMVVGGVKKAAERRRAAAARAEVDAAIEAWKRDRERAAGQASAPAAAEPPAEPPPQ